MLARLVRGLLHCLQVAMGLIISSLILLPWADTSTLSWIGLVSGVLFVASTAATFNAIANLGLGVSSAIWFGSSVLASSIFGIRFNQEEASNPDLAAGGMLVMVLGLAAAAVNGRYNEFINSQREEGAASWRPCISP